MSRWSRSMSPAAFVLSILALVVATSAGTAYAAVKIGTKQLKNGAVTSAKIKNGTVASVDVRDGGVTGADVANGSLGTADLSGAAQKSLRGARAYTTVDPSPSGGTIPELRAARTRGFTAVTESGAGLYCLTLDPTTGIDAATATVVVGVDEQTTYGLQTPRAAWNSTTDCGAGKIRIETYNNSVLADGVGFTVIIG